MCILVSFRYLIDEFYHGQYNMRALPRSLQEILTVSAGQRAALALEAALILSAPRSIDVDRRAGGGVITPRERHRNNRDREVTPNSRPIQHLRILSGENT